MAEGNNSGYQGKAKLRNSNSKRILENNSSVFACL
jgi:hypothetical protein